MSTYAPTASAHGESNSRTASLTARQREIALLVARGLSNRDIGARLGLSEGTVANYVRRLLGKYELASRAQVGAWAAERGLITGYDGLLALLEHLLAIDTPNLTAALDAASEPIGKALRAEKLDVFLFDPAADMLVAVGRNDTPLARKQRMLGLDRLPLSRSGQIGRVFLSGAPCVSGHVDTDPDELDAVKDGLGVRSAVYAPLDVLGERRGVVSAASTQPEQFTQRDMQLMHTIARWVGLVVHRSELIAQRVEAATERGRQAAAEELIAVVAHDLRNHLTPMQARIQMLRARAANDDRRRDQHDLDGMNAAVQRLERLVSDLLDRSRLDHGLFALRPRRMDLAKLVREVLADIYTPDRELVLRAPQELYLMGDPDRLRQVLGNLLANALQHAPDDSLIILGVQVENQASDARRAVVLVKNDGPSIPPEVLARMFQRYHTGSDSNGVGLGLYVARGIAQAHGGTLDVESADGRGTTFRLALPLSE